MPNSIFRVLPYAYFVNLNSIGNFRDPFLPDRERLHQWSSKR